MVIYLKDGTQEHVFKPDEPDEYIKIVRERLGADIADALQNIFDSFIETSKDVDRLEEENQALESENEDLTDEVEKLKGEIDSLKKGQVKADANT